MTARLAPQAALYGGERALPRAAAVRALRRAASAYIRKALALQAERGPVFDIACDCEDGAPIGAERAHAVLMAGLIGGADNRYARVGARVHDVHHPAWQAEVDVLLDGAGDRIAFLTLPKAESAADVERFFAHVADRVAQLGLRRTIPASVLIETPGALHDAWKIAALPGVVSLDFGLMDFVSAHHGAIPASAMVSPGPVRASAGAPRQVRDRGRRARARRGARAQRDARARRSRARVRRCAPRPRRVRLPAHVEHPSVADRPDRRRDAARSVRR